MMSVEVGTTGQVAVGARLYRWRGERLLAVIVKAAYALEQRSVMTLLPPVPWRTKPSAAHGGDEPFPLPMAELIVGPLAQAARQPGAEIALTLTRGAEVLLDVRRRAGEEGARDAAVGFGPVPSTAPARAALAAAMDPSAFRGTRELPLEARFDPAFFQCAPPTQRLDELRPGDAIALLGMSHVIRSLQVRLPPHRGVAAVQIGARPTARLALRFDRVHLAPDALVAELSYRGVCEVPADALAIRVAAGLDAPDAPWATPDLARMRMVPLDVAADAPPPAPVVEERPPATVLLQGAIPHGGTVVMGSPEPATTRAPAPLESTAVVMPDAPAPTSLPFQRSPRPSETNEGHAPSDPIPGAPWAHRPARQAPPVDDGAPETVVLGEPGGEEIDLPLELDAQPPPPAPAAPVAEVQPRSARAARAKADPWRKDPEAPPPPAPVPPPPPPKAAATRPDLSSGLYKRFKR